MTLEEAIKHCEEKADELNKEVLNQANLCNAKEMAECQKCARNHEQLAEWLNELAGYRGAMEDYIDGNVTATELGYKLAELFVKGYGGEV